MKIDEYFCREPMSASEVSPVGAERLGGGVEVEPVAGLVLHLGGEHGLATQGWRAAEPHALGLHADDLGVAVLSDLAHEGATVAVGHPVARLDARAVRDRLVEVLLQGVVRCAAQGCSKTE